MHKAFLIAALVACFSVFIVSTSCATSSPLPTAMEPQVFDGISAPYHLTLGAGFRPYLAGAKSFDGIWRNRSGTHFIAVVVSAPTSLAALGKLVAEKAQKAGYEKMEILDVIETTVAGFPARRTQIALQNGATKFLMWNTHVVTKEASYQIINWGPLAHADALRSSVLAIEKGGLKLNDHAAVSFDDKMPSDAAATAGHPDALP